METLEITINSASSLKDINTIGTMEPYVLVTLSSNPKHVQRTDVALYGGTNPKWRSKTMKFAVNEDVCKKQNVTLEFKIMADKSFGVKEVGEVVLLVKELFQAQQSEKSLSCIVLTPSGRPQGTLNLRYKLVMSGTRYRRAESERSVASCYDSPKAIESGSSSYGTDLYPHSPPRPQAPKVVAAPYRHLSFPQPRQEVAPPYRHQPSPEPLKEVDVRYRHQPSPEPRKEAAAPYRHQPRQQPRQEVAPPYRHQRSPEPLKEVDVRYRHQPSPEPRKEAAAPYHHQPRQQPRKEVVAPYHYQPSPEPLKEVDVRYHHPPSPPPNNPQQTEYYPTSQQRTVYPPQAQAQAQAQPKQAEYLPPPNYQHPPVGYYSQPHLQGYHPQHLQGYIATPPPGSPHAQHYPNYPYAQPGYHPSTPENQLHGKVEESGKPAKPAKSGRGGGKGKGGWLGDLASGAAGIVGTALLGEASSSLFEYAASEL